MTKGGYYYMGRPRLNEADYIGKKYNRLTIISFANQAKGSTRVICECECKNVKEYSLSDIKGEFTKSCGCLRQEIAKDKANKVAIHGMWDTRLYKTLKGIKQRCYNQNNQNYLTCGGKGIVICDEWLNDFMSFYNWSMANGYADNLILVRKNANGNFEPNNCMWGTYSNMLINRGKREDTEKGIRFYKSTQKWAATIRYNNTTVYIGKFDTEKEAVATREKKLAEYQEILLAKNNKEKNKIIINDNTETYDYTVYIHTVPNNKKYIGITQQIPEMRWRNGQGYINNQYFARAIKKYGWNNIRSEILYTGLSKEQAEQKEIELIALHKSNNKRYGYNIANGGNCTGTTSEETKKKISISNMGKNSCLAKSLYQCDLQGNIIKKWDCTMDVQRELGFNNSQISRCCSDGRPTAYGFRWIYCDKYIESEMKQLYIRNKIMRKVNQYSLNGEFIAEHESLRAAALSINLDRHSGNNIGNCCRGKCKQSHGYIWKYENDKTPVNINDIGKRERKPVNQYLKDGTFVKQYKSAIQAVEENNWNEYIVEAIRRNCRNECKLTKGFVWEYA